MPMLVEWKPCAFLTRISIAEMDQMTAHHDTLLIIEIHQSVKGSRVRC